MIFFPVENVEESWYLVVSEVQVGVVHSCGCTRHMTTVSPENIWICKSMQTILALTSSSEVLHSYPESFGPG